MKDIFGFLLLGFAAVLLIGSAAPTQASPDREVFIMVNAENLDEEVEFDAVLLPSSKPLREVLTLKTPWGINIPEGYPWVGIFESRGGKVAVERFVKSEEGLQRTSSAIGYRVLAASDFPEAGGLVATWPPYSDTERSQVYTVKQIDISLPVLHVGLGTSVRD